MNVGPEREGFLTEPFGFAQPREIGAEAFFTFTTV